MWHVDEGKVPLLEAAEALIADLPHHPAGRAARTLVSGPLLRAVMIALREGAEMSEHEAPEAATLYVVTGEVTVRAGDLVQRVSAGELVPVPAVRHSVEAHADSAILLTVLRR